MPLTPSSDDPIPANGAVSLFQEHLKLDYSDYKVTVIDPFTGLYQTFDVTSAEWTVYVDESNAAWPKIVNRAAWLKRGDPEFLPSGALNIQLHAQ